jgi:hypothetical protein
MKWVGREKWLKLQIFLLGICMDNLCIELVLKFKRLVQKLEENMLAASVDSAPPMAAG